MSRSETGVSVNFDNITAVKASEFDDSYGIEIFFHNSKETDLILYCDDRKECIELYNKILHYCERKNIGLVLDGNKLGRE